MNEQKLREMRDQIGGATHKELRELEAQVAEMQADLDWLMSSVSVPSDVEVRLLEDVAKMIGARLLRSDWAACMLRNRKELNNE